MSKSKYVLIAAMLLGAVPLISTAYAEGEQSQGVSTGAEAQSVQNPGSDAQEQPDPAHPYDIKSFFADFQRFTIGSVVPDRYRTRKYEIIDWKTRNLPEPDEGTSWTYMGGNYVLFSKDDGKIIKAKSGDIFYKQS